MSINRVVALDDDEDFIKLLEQFSLLVEVDFIGFSDPTQFNSEMLKDGDLLLVDIYMPNNDGLDILMDLRKTNFRGAVAIMSGAPDSIIDSVISLVENLNFNLQGVLRKPLKMKEFHALIASPTLQQLDKPSGLTAHTANMFSQLFTKHSLTDWFEQQYIYPAYQPQICSKTKSLTGVECLTRVNHPELGVLNPAQFIRLVESAGLIDTYTLLLIQTTLDQIHQLLNKKLIPNISFNVSAISLNIAFVDNLVSLIKRYDLDVEQITIEITETSAITMNTDANYAISRLKVFGVLLSIDDFGTGYASIRQLVELPFDELKIDRSFISELETNKTSQVIVNATLDLATNLGFRIVIEGIETQTQLGLVSNKAVFAIQGYLFSKPLSIEELKIYIEKPILQLIN